MERKNVVKDKSYQFAKDIVIAARYLTSVTNEYVLSKQLLRSGTAIGALVREAEMAESRKDFIHKMSIALKEANETLYWIDLLIDTQSMNGIDSQNLRERSQELVRLLVSIVKTSKL